MKTKFVLQCHSLFCVYFTVVVLNCRKIGLGVASLVLVLVLVWQIWPCPDHWCRVLQTTGYSACKRDVRDQDEIDTPVFVRHETIGVDLAGILGGRMTSAEGGSVPSGMGYGGVRFAAD